MTHKAVNAKQAVKYAIEEFTKDSLEKPWHRPVAITERLSKKSGYTPETIRNWADGKTNPRFNNVLDLIESAGYELVIRKNVGEVKSENIKT